MTPSHIPASTTRTGAIPSASALPSRRAVLISAAAVTTAAATTSLVAPAAEASDTLPWVGDRAAGKNQPSQRAYTPAQMLTWEPASDPDAELLRSRVPLQKRAAPCAEAQRAPDLPAGTQSLVLAGDYGNAFFESHPYTDVFAQHVFEYWQYTDVHASWHGMASRGTPSELYDPEAEWTERWFEFGAINPPNPGYTDAAHRNGVLCLGTIFFSDNDRGSQHFAELLVRDDDGTFPIATKLGEMARYYGFDGYFVNQEQESVSMTAQQRTDYREFMHQLRADDLYVQWYDSVTDAGEIDYQNEFNAANSPWVTNREQGRVSDSIFLNYWWDRQKLEDSAAHARFLDLDPLQTVFTGVEAGMYQFDQPYDLQDNLDADGSPLTAIATLGADFTHADLEGKTDNALQHEAFDRARRWWTGVSEGEGSPAEDAWQGMSAYIAERTAITGTTFHTNFSTGHGLGRWRSGELVSETEWGAIGVQDLPVTWQWWFEGDGEMRADFDYGPEHVPAERFSYTPVGAYEGGNSLVVEGDLDGDAVLRLFRTELEITATTDLALAVRVPSGTVEITVALALSEDPGTLIEVPLELDGAAERWAIGHADLSEYSGETVTALGIGLHTDQEQAVQVNLGSITLGPAEQVAPARPERFGITRALLSTGELVLGWEIADFADVSRYEVSADGEPLGAVYGEGLYVKDFAGATGTLELVAVGHDGQRSEPATLAYDLASGPGEVHAEAAEDGTVTVSWSAPCHPLAHVTVEALDGRGRRFRGRARVRDGALEAVIEGAPTNGARFIATVDDRRSTPVSTISNFADTELESYPEDFAHLDGVELVLRRPSTEDWSTLTVLEDDRPLKFETTYSQGERDHWIRGRASRESLTQTLASADSRVVVTLTDYTGNSAETVLREGADG